MPSSPRNWRSGEGISLSNRAGDQAGEFNPTSRQFGLPLPEQIAEVLATEIINRDLTPGSRLPEPTLAERFGTSRAPIREAFYLLDQAGLVERTPRRGTVVKAYTRREIEEIYQVRITLERLALERICESPELVDACLAALEPIIREMKVVQDDPIRYRELSLTPPRTALWDVSKSRWSIRIGSCPASSSVGARPRPRLPPPPVISTLMPPTS